MTGRLFVVGTSMGGVSALQRLIGLLPKSFPAAVLVVVHTTPDGPGCLPELLSRCGRLPATHARQDESIVAGRVYVAPPDRHLMVRPGGLIHLSRGPKENRTRPAIDPTFRSAAVVYGPGAVGVVLTGYLDDGTAGLLAIKDCGGVAMVQDPDEASAPSMPRSALRHVDVDHCGPLSSLAERMVQLANDAPRASRETDPRRVLEIEEHMASGLTGADWARLSELCRGSRLNCPDCRNALYEIPDLRLLRFRCRAGHAFTARSLLSAQADTREDLIGSLTGALFEEAALARRMSLDPLVRQEGADLPSRAAVLEQHAACLTDWLAEPTPGSEADPTA